jgi:hypothetical protein
MVSGSADDKQPRPKSNSSEAASRNSGFVWGIAACVVALTVTIIFLNPQWFAAPSAPNPAENRPSAASSALTPVATVPDATLPIGGARWDEIDDPAQDGWDTEVFAEQATEQLKKLGKMLLDPQTIGAAELGHFVTEDFSCERLIPDDLQTAFESSDFLVERARVDTESDRSEELGPVRGAEGLSEVLAAIGEPFRDAGNARFKFKLLRVTPSSDAIITRQLFTISGATSSGMAEQHATWVIRWQASDDRTSPKLQWIGVEDFEQVDLRHPGGPLFTDCTESALGANDCYREQFLRGMNYWLERIQDKRYFAVLGNPGLVVGDANGDGLDDLYVCQESGLPNRLFLQKPDGTARDVSEEWGVDWIENTRSGLLIDLDNDGDQDLVVATVGSLVLAENSGQRFEVRTILATDEDTMSLSSADFDNDGDLDLYVCVNFQNDVLDETQRVSFTGVATDTFTDANNGGRNSLFRNDISPDGDWQFTDVAKQVGLVNNRRISFAASWDDFDNDGDQDLYVANDYGRNNLYRNEGAVSFVDIAAEADAEDRQQGMSVSWGDYDRDGRMDVYIANMFSAAGERITHQPRFQPDAPQSKAVLQRFARGSTLLRNVADASFQDVSYAAAVTVGGWAWGSNFSDLNNDGWEDLIVANGFITTDDGGDL